MGLFDKLPTLGEINARPRSMPKFTADHEPLQVERAKATDSDRRKIGKWSKKVRDRDEWRCRYDGAPVNPRAVDGDPRRAEAHHIVKRRVLAVRYDVRNGICLSAEAHAKVEGKLLRIEGTRFFEIEGKKYIDATFLVRFVPTGKMEK